METAGTEIASDVKQTNDPAQMRKVIQTLFCVRADVVLRTPAGKQMRVARLRYNADAGLLLMETEEPADGERRDLIVAHRDHVMHLRCESAGRAPDGAEVLRPKLLKIVPRQRREERHAIPEEAGRVLWISGALPIEQIPQSMAGLNEKRDAIVRVYGLALKEALAAVQGEEIVANVHLRRSNRLDHRMRPMNSYGKPIFVPNRFEEIPFDEDLDLSELVPYTEYKKIRAYDDLPNSFISEICMPLWFRGAYMFGYLQALKKDPFEAKHYEVVKQLAAKMEADMLGHGCLPKNPARCPIIDFSQHGVGFFHPSGGNVARSFMPGEELIFDIHWPDDHVSTLTGAIKSIKAHEKAYRIGVALDSMPVDATDRYMQFVLGQESSD